MWGLLGLDAESQARGEMEALNSGRTGFRSWDLGDMARSALTGVGREQLEQRSAELLEQQINENSLPNQQFIRDSLGGTEVDISNLDIKPGETEAQHRSRLAGLMNTGRAVMDAEANTPNFDRSTVGAGATAGSVRGNQRSRLDQNTEETKAETERLRLEAQARSDRQFAATQNLAIGQLALSNTQAANQFQIAQMNNRLQMRREDAREARMERKDKREAIQQLMAGLAQMGASIAI